MESKLFNLKTIKMESQTLQEMPRYKSHKEVWALKIEKIIPDNDQVKQMPAEGIGATLVFEDGGSERVNGAYLKKHNPQEGGYYVVYEDGYKSWSPAEAFESGYTRSDSHKQITAEDRNLYNPTCAVSGERGNLQMFPIRNERDEMIGWIFLSELIERDAYDFSLNRELKK